MDELCKCGAWLNGPCDDDDRDSFETWPGSMNKMWKMTVACGYTGGLTSVKDHMKRLCKCYTKAEK